MIQVTDKKTPNVEDNSILIQEKFGAIPTPPNQLSSGVYYSWKGKWTDMWDKFITRAQALIDLSLARYVPTVVWGGITGTLSNQTDLQNALNAKVDNDEIYKNGLSSGLISGGALSINTNPAQFDVASGVGVIVDSWTDPLIPVVYNVTWDAFTAQTLTYLATNTFTHIYIDKDGAIYQSDVFSNGELRREYIHLGRINHTNNTTIGSITDAPDLYVSPVNQLRDLEEAIGVIGRGNVVTANGANLSIDVSDGTMYLNGVNYDVNPKNPSFIQFSNVTAPTFRYRTQTGNGTNATTIDPTKYDNAGTITAIGSTKSTNPRVYRTANGNIVVQYGQTIYNSLSDAISAIPSETFVVYPNLEEYAVLIAIISIQTNCASLLDTTRSRITTPFTIGGGSGTSLQDLSQVLATGNTTGGTDLVVSSGDYLNLDGETSSTIAVIDAFKNLISADTATYPSLTELSYVKGLTSSAQDQLDAVAYTNVGVWEGTATITGTVALTAFSGAAILVAGGTYSVGDNVYFEATATRNTGGANVVDIRVYNNTTNTLVGANSIANFQCGTAHQMPNLTRRNINIDSATVTYYATNNIGTDNPQNNTTVTLGTINIDWTIDQYLIPAGLLTNSGDSISLQRFKVYKG